MSHSNANFVSNRHHHLVMSTHAHKRAQQRGIDKNALPLVLAYGQYEYDGQGGMRYFMSKQSLDNLIRVVGPSKRIQALAGVYAVISMDGATVITMGHRYH